jgi:hypothetical protein
MTKKRILLTPVVLTILLSLVGCASEDKSTQPLNSDDPSQGKLIWDESDPEEPSWRLECPNKSDYRLWTESTLSEIRSDESLVSFCDTEARRLNLPNPFTLERAESEVDALIAVMPKYKICSSGFLYRIGLMALEQAESEIGSAELRKELGDFIGGTLDLTKAERFKNEANYLITMNEDDAVQISKTSAGNICGDIQIY